MYCFIPLITCRPRRIVLLSVGIHTDKCVISGLLSVWIHTAVCASIYRTVHTLALTLNPTLTLNLTLISSYLTNKHQYPQPNMSANWMTSRLRDQSAAICSNYSPQHILECSIILKQFKVKGGVAWVMWPRKICALNAKISRLVLLSVLVVLTDGSFVGYCQYGSVLSNLAGVCASIYHTIPP